MLLSPHIALRTVAHSCFVTLVKATWAGDCDEAKLSISGVFRSLVQEFFAKKNTRVSAAMVEELVTKNPDFCVAAGLPVLLDACSSGRSGA